VGRIAVGVEYDGAPFCGWQQQDAAPSIQQTLQQALSFVADEPVTLLAAGRTDAGVHARAQVAHFDARAERSARSWVLGANSQLPPTISLRWAQAVPDDFHARYSALWRRYRYLILNRPARSALSGGRALCVHQPLEVAAMSAAAMFLIGEHDFSAFRAAECQARSPVRHVTDLTVRRLGEWVQVDITANAFLHHMVRNIVGLLLVIGRGQAPPQRAREQLASGQRSTGEATAAAHGLYLWQVGYPPACGLPDDSAMIGPPELGWG